MNELVEFLRARLAEGAAEQHERYCSGGWHANRCAVHYDDWPEGGPPQRKRPHPCDCGAPDQVLRAVEAKRKLIDTVMAWEHQLLHTGCEENAGPFPCSRDGAECDPVMCGVGEKQDQVLRALAAEHADHPDYQKEAWAL